MLVGGGGPLFPSLLPFSLFFALFMFPNSIIVLWVVSLFFFYGCLKLRFPDVEDNSGPRAAPLNAAELCLPTSMVCMATEMS